MKKLLAVTGVILIVYVILSSAAGQAARTAPQHQDASPAAIYTLCDENNRVVVYCNGDVLLRTDTAVSTLPKHDRMRLREGITVFSEEELKQLVEDLCS